MKRKFKLINCPCGCGGKFHEWLNPTNTGYEVIDKSFFEGKVVILKIKRLSDGQLFSLGDTIKRVTARGKSYGLAVIEKIQVEESGFMQVHTYTVGSNGSACMQLIKGKFESGKCVNGDYPNFFDLMVNVTEI